ncbi:tyrosine-type recombinase/integrase [Phyllobacterium zundukense]|uniref:Tyr recombinase domain-containing protein n=1 Tax=Phyllobacterium zundukense TaxID=1867719 RepID=A0A2N9W4U0_9HYPH|nr:site-specific integrase [Phyllobacterium zundukense]PIO46758.1 hypothetical protein B5P45_02885 [Phyllobacterium zundukense]
MAGRKNLTARFVETVKVDVRTDYWDDVVRGLVLRVSPTGVKSWTVVYHRESDGAKRRVTIGKFPAIDLAKARAKALGAVTAVSDGEDPAGKKRARRDSMTVRELGALYVEKYAKRNKRTWAEDERLLKVEVYPEIGDMKALAVKRRDILDIIESKADAGFLAQSTQILAVVRKAFNWAVENDYLESSPVIGVKPRAKPTRRERVLSDDEIRTLWKALSEVPILSDTVSIFRLLLLTGQRSGEVCGIVRSEIDLEKAIWTIPGVRTKNGLTHVVPLSDEALAIVAAALETVDEEGNASLFSRIGNSIEPNAVAQAARLKLQLLGMPWTPHDLRRTVATGMAGIGVMPHIVEATLNHISGFRAGVAGVYNRAAYEPEKRRALDMWAEHIIAIVKSKSSKIVDIAGARR